MLLKRQPIVLVLNGRLSTATCVFRPKRGPKACDERAKPILGSVNRAQANFVIVIGAIRREPVPLGRGMTRRSVSAIRTKFAPQAEICRIMAGETERSLGRKS